MYVCMCASPFPSAPGFQHVQTWYTRGDARRDAVDRPRGTHAAPVSHKPPDWQHQRGGGGAACREWTTPPPQQQQQRQVGNICANHYCSALRMQLAGRLRAAARCPVSLFNPAPPSILSAPGRKSHQQAWPALVSATLPAGYEAPACSGGGRRGTSLCTTVLQVQQ